MSESSSPFAACIFGPFVIEPPAESNPRPTDIVIPDVRYHLQNAEGLFYCFDKYSDDDEFWSEFTNPFLCCWDSPKEALRHAVPALGQILRVSINGELK